MQYVLLVYSILFLIHLSRVEGELDGEMANRPIYTLLYALTTKSIKTEQSKVVIAFNAFVEIVFAPLMGLLIGIAYVLCMAVAGIGRLFKRGK